MTFRCLSALALLPFALAACEGDSLPPTNTPGDVPMSDAASLDAPDAPDDVPADYTRPPDVPRTMSEADLATQRRSCAFRTGAWPAETLGREVPLGDAIPIRHVLVVMMENRSFDHYFSQLRARGVTDVEAPPEGWSNPRADGTPVPRYHETQLCVRDTNHEWEGSFHQWNNGRNDGFVTTNNPMGERAMGYFDEADIPFYYGLARTFAIGDHYFASVMGPTWPNRYYMLAATSFGFTYNAPYGGDTADAPAMHILRRLDEAGYEWRDYAGDLRLTALFPWYGIVRTETREHYRNHTQLMADLRSGDLPAFAFIEPRYQGTGETRQDEHPPGTPQSGERFVEGIVRALMASPAWSSSALFINYDEHGGFADHVPPPEACAPDDHAPFDNRFMPTADGSFRRYGFRVPFIVVSPYAKRGYVSHTVYDHASVLRFIEARFGLAAMTGRDANATPPMDMFDFEHPPFMTPPTLPMGGYDADAQRRCGMLFPSSGGL